MSIDDETEIVNVINRYALAVDTQTWELFDQVFTDDIAADYFGGGPSWTDLAAFKRDFEMIHAVFEATQHTTTNHQVVVDGDRATALSYVHGRFIRDMPEGGNMFESNGWYEDLLVRTSAGWRIQNRICRMIWGGGNPQVMAPAPDAPVQLSLTSLRAEAQAGRVSLLAALAGK